ncbi:MAG: hypothetical protein ACOCZ7_02170 [Armatimonadota bacterium]
MKRIGHTIALAALSAILAGAAFAQEGLTPEDRERLEQERIERMRDLAREQGAGPAIQVWGMAGEGPGAMTRIGGPVQRMPEELIFVEDGPEQVVFLIRGHTLHRYVAGVDGPLSSTGHFDLRTDQEIERAEDAEDAFTWPDPAMVSVTAKWSAASNSLIVLRGGVLTQFPLRGLEPLASFDLRTEREKQSSPRVQVRMQPGPLPPPPAPDEAGGG